MKKWNLIVDVGSCTNCNACVLAGYDEHVGNTFPGYAAEMPKHGRPWIDVRQKVRGQAPMIDVAYLPVMCQHCDEPPCMAAAKDGAICKRDDGIVLIDPVKSKGQRQLIDACPYGAIVWNDELDIPQHWIFDAHLLDQGWKEPRAAQVCATEAIRAVQLEDDEMAARAEAEGLEPFHPEYGTGPRVWYKNLDRYTKCFIGGSVESEANGVVDCVAGARVVLTKDGRQIQETETDTFGDFRLDGLDPNSGDYTVEISAAAGHGPKTLQVSLGESTYLGDITL